MQGLLTFCAISLSIFVLLMVGHIFARRTRMNGFRMSVVETSTPPSRNGQGQALDKAIMCPYCLSLGTIARSTDEHRRFFFTCSNCDDKIPSEYARDLTIPRHVVSAVSIRGHGVSVYFASLFHSIDALSDLWPGFYALAADEHSLTTIRYEIEALSEGHLLDATPMSFPAPTIIRFSHMPNFGDQFFLFYDVGGEVYRCAGNLTQHAGLVAQSRTVLFLISLGDLERFRESIYELLSVYTLALSDLERNTKEQHMVVVLAKGDQLESRLSNYPEVWRYLMEGSVDQLRGSGLNNYINHMKGISRQLRRFLTEEVMLNQVINFAEDRFKTVEYSIVSALGAKPETEPVLKAVTPIAPKRIMDPLLWILVKA